VCGTRSPHPWPRNYALQTMVMQRDSQQTLEDEIGRVANAVGGSSGNADPLRQVRSMRSEVEGSSSSSSRKERFNAEEFKQRSSSSFQHNAQPNHSHTPTASAALRQSFQNSKRQSQSFSGDPGERGDPDGGGRGGGTDAAVVAGMLFNEQHARGGGSSSSSKAALLSPYSSLQSETARGQSDTPSPSSPLSQTGGEGPHLSETGGGYVALPTLEKAGLGAFIPALQEQKYRKQQAERGSGGKLNEKSLSRSLSSSGEEYLTLGDLSPVFISDLSLAQVGMTPLQIRKLRFAVNSDLSSGSGDDDGGGGEARTPPPQHKRKHPLPAVGQSANFTLQPLESAGGLRGGVEAAAAEGHDQASVSSGRRKSRDAPGSSSSAAATEASAAEAASPPARRPSDGGAGTPNNAPPRRKSRTPVTPRTPSAQSQEI